jgi:hypothetical protein
MLLTFHDICLIPALGANVVPAVEAVVAINVPLPPEVPEYNPSA